MDLREIVELVNLVAARDITEFEVETQGFRLRIVKPDGATPPPRVDAAAAPLTAPAAVERVSGAVAVKAAAVEEAAEEPGLFVMKAPIVGTFYRAASPAAEPYAKVGDRVKRGQVVCIIEAMKLMNEIEVEVSGTVVDILVEDGQPVEYGEPLFKIRPDK